MVACFGILGVRELHSFSMPGPQQSSLPGKFQGQPGLILSRMCWAVASPLPGCKYYTVPIYWNTHLIIPGYPRTILLGLDFNPMDTNPAQDPWKVNKCKLAQIDIQHKIWHPGTTMLACMDTCYNNNRLSIPMNLVWYYAAPYREECLRGLNCIFLQPLAKPNPAQLPWPGPALPPCPCLPIPTVSSPTCAMHLG